MNSDYLKVQEILYNMNIQSFSPQKLSELAEALKIKKTQNNIQLYQKIINFVLTSYQSGFKLKQGQYIQQILPKTTPNDIKTFIKNMFAYFHGYKFENAKGSTINRQPNIMGNNFPTIPGLNFGNYSNLQELANVDPYFYQRMYMPQMMYPMSNYQSFYPGFMNNYMNGLSGMPYSYYQKQYEKYFNMKSNPDLSKTNMNLMGYNTPPQQNFQQSFGIKNPISPTPSDMVLNPSPIQKDNIQQINPNIQLNQTDFIPKPSKEGTFQIYKSLSESQPNMSLPLKKNPSNKQMKSTIASSISKNINPIINYNVNGVSTRRVASEVIQPTQKDQRQRSRNKVESKISNTQEYIPHAKKLSQKVSSQKTQKFEFKKQLQSCVCKGYAPLNIETFECQNCHKLFHFNCLKIRKQVQPFEGDKRIKLFCAMCKLRSLDPLQQIEKVISESYIESISENKFVQTINLKQFFPIFSKKNHSNEIQLRCIRLNLLDNNEITWPDECTLKVNNEKIIQFPALQQNSSSKKRKDISLHIGKSVFQFFGQSELEKVKVTLQVKKLAKQEAAIKRINNNYVFVLGVYLIKKLTPQALYDKIVLDNSCWEGDNYITKLFETDANNEVQIEQINVSIYDPYTRDIIKTPARGSKCKHGQCFDLKVFLSFMSVPKNRLWRCPICTKDCLNIKIDSKQSKIFTQMTSLPKLPSQISFNKKGEATFIVQEEQQSHERFRSHKKKLANEKHVITQTDLMDDQAKARLKTLKKQTQKNESYQSQSGQENEKNSPVQQKQSKNGQNENPSGKQEKQNNQNNPVLIQAMQAEKDQGNRENKMNNKELQQGQISKEKSNMVQKQKEVEEKKPIELIIESQSMEANIEQNKD